MDLTTLKTDLNAAEEGIYFPFGDDGARVKIAMWHNKRHLKFIRDLHKAKGRKIEAGMINEKESELLLSDQWEFIVTDMLGFTEGEDDLIYSVSAIKDLSLNPQYKQFFLKIEGIAKAEENYRVENIQDLGEQSPTT
jgi:hypothetical protein